MIKIFGKDNLENLNIAAQLSVDTLAELNGRAEEIAKFEDPRILVKYETLFRMAQGYMFLYNKVIESGMMPSPTSKAGAFTKIH